MTLVLGLKKTAIEMADAVIAVSEETKEDVLAHFNVDESKVKVVYNGIDLQEYQASSSTETLKKFNINPEQPFVLFVGRITRQKELSIW